MSSEGVCPVRIGLPVASNDRLIRTRCSKVIEYPARGRVSRIHEPAQYYKRGLPGAVTGSRKLPDPGASDKR